MKKFGWLLLVLALMGALMAMNYIQDRSTSEHTAGCGCGQH